MIRMRVTGNQQLGERWFPIFVLILSCRYIGKTL